MDAKLTAALALALILAFSGCVQQPEKIDITGAFALEKNSACGKYSITTQANLKYFADLNSEFAKALQNGDQVEIAGILSKSQECSKIIPDSQKVISRRNTAQFGAAVSVDYILRLADGNIVSTSLKDIAVKENLRLDENAFVPLKFKAGTGTYLDGRQGKVFEKVGKAVVGMRVGEEKTIELSASEGFGEYNNSKIVKLEREKWPLPPNADPDIGVDVSFFFGTYAVVKGFDKNFIYFDLNPKFAGQKAVFWFRLADINNEAIQMSKNIVEEGDTIKVDYVGQLLDGNVFDSSEGRQPLEFTVGAGQMIKGFDKGVVGMKLGEEKTVTILPQDAYGEVDPRMILTIDKNTADYKARFPNDPLIGSEISVPVSINDKDTMLPALVSKIDTNSITLDFNHKLAGKTLKFKITVREIKKAA